MKWNYINKTNKINKVNKVNKINKISNTEIIEILLENRGVKTKTEREEFLNPPSPYSLTPSALNIDPKQLSKAIKRIQKAIDMGEPIVVYGDYDVDGICSTAILWETLRDLKALAMPFIPGREKEGYGLSVEGIKTIIEDSKYGINKSIRESGELTSLTQLPSNSIKKGLLITVDNGIVANEAVEYANDSGLDVIILDHHEIGKTLPKAYAIVHTLELCAAGITYLFCMSLRGSQSDRSNPSQEPIASPSVRNDEERDDKLELAAIATVADLVPLVGPNRSIVKYGLEALNNTKRPGLQALCEVAGIKKIGTYEIGYLIAPRINASGRIDSALVGLRLLCTKDFKRASEFATKLNEINKERQGMVETMVLHAMEMQQLAMSNDQYKERIIILEHESYHQGVIGLIAGKLVERYYLPAIVIAKGEKISKASARSISGFNIIEAIRDSSKLLINAGGHPMAAGFSIETTRIGDFRMQIAKYASVNITEEILERSLKVDLEIGLDNVSMDLLNEISKLSPFGIGNPEPVFASEVKVETVRTMGTEGKHLKLTLSHPGQAKRDPGSSRVEVAGFRVKPGMTGNLEAVGFGMGNLSAKLAVGDKIELAYCLSLNGYMGSKTLQLKIRDIKDGRIN